MLPRQNRPHRYQLLWKRMEQYPFAMTVEISMPSPHVNHTRNLGWTGVLTIAGRQRCFSLQMPAGLLASRGLGDRSWKSGIHIPSWTEAPYRNAFQLSERTRNILTSNGYHFITTKLAARSGISRPHHRLLALATQPNQSCEPSSVCSVSIEV